MSTVSMPRLARFGTRPDLFIGCKDTLFMAAMANFHPSKAILWVGGARCHQRFLEPIW